MNKKNELLFKVHCVIFCKRQTDRQVIFFFFFVSQIPLEWNATLKIAMSFLPYICCNNNRVDVDWMPLARSIHTVPPRHFSPPNKTIQ